LPFHCFIDLPTRLILGRATTAEAWQGLGIALVWAVLFGMMARFIWQRGLLRYSGAGM
jgi:ABC-2 type transport system permease protein